MTTIVAGVQGYSSLEAQSNLCIVRKSGNTLPIIYVKVSNFAIAIMDLERIFTLGTNAALE